MSVNNKMGIYIFCLGLVSLCFIVFSSIRYKYDNFDRFFILLTAFAISVVITTFTLAGLRDSEPTIESVFAEEFTIYAANEDKLLDFEQLNEKGMLSEDGKDKALALTEKNADLYAKLDNKLVKSETFIKYKEKEPVILYRVFTSVFIVYLSIVVIYTESQLMVNKKNELVKVLSN